MAIRHWGICCLLRRGMELPEEAAGLVERQWEEVDKEEGVNSWNPTD